MAIKMSRSGVVSRRSAVVMAAAPKGKVANFQRTSPEALAQFRREMNSGASSSSSSSSYSAPAKPATPASSSSWRTADVKPAAPAAPARPSSSSRPSSKVANFQRTSPEALAQFRREMNSGASSSSSSSSSYSAPAASSSSWRTADVKPAAPAAPARPTSSSRPFPKVANFQRTSPEALAQFRREMAASR